MHELQLVLGLTDLLYGHFLEIVRTRDFSDSLHRHGDNDDDDDDDGEGLLYQCGS